MSTTAIPLSICIATYKRAEFIGATLESILQQAPPDVEVLVVDGASPDETETIVQGFAERYPQVRYVRLEAKGGVDQDYDKAVGYARGTYCWLMSDDDLLRPGAVAAVLAQLAHGYGLIVVNAEIRDQEVSRLLATKRVAMDADRVYQPTEADRQRMMGDLGLYLSFIGCVVIRRDLWMSRNRERYYGTAFIHVGVIFQAPLSLPVLAIAEPWITIRMGNAQWTSRFWEIWMLQWPQLIWSFPDYSDAVKNRVSRKEPWARPLSLFLLRGCGTYEADQYRKFVAPRTHGWRRVVARAITVLPGTLVNRLSMLYARLRGAGATVYELQNSPHYYRRRASS